MQKKKREKKRVEKKSIFNRNELMSSAESKIIFVSKSLKVRAPVERRLVDDVLRRSEQLQIHLHSYSYRYRYRDTKIQLQLQLLWLVCLTLTNAQLDGKRHTLMSVCVYIMMMLQVCQPLATWPPVNDSLSKYLAPRYANFSYSFSLF